jgi:hypothetical protein
MTMKGVSIDYWTTLMVEVKRKNTSFYVIIFYWMLVELFQSGDGVAPFVVNA